MARPADSPPSYEGFHTRQQSQVFRPKPLLGVQEDDARKATIEGKKVQSVAKPLNLW